jgi:hypothetical protein
MGFEKKAAQSKKGNVHAKKGQRDESSPRQREANAEQPVELFSCNDVLYLS